MDIVQVIFSNQIIPLELYLAPCPSLAETALRLVAFFFVINWKYFYLFDSLPYQFRAPSL